MKRSTRDSARMVVAGVAVLVVGVYLLRRSLPSMSDLIPSQQTVRDGAAAVGGYAGQAAAGAIEGVGAVVGIPRTDATACERAKASGDWWAASFACPAGDFVSSAGSAAWAGMTGPAAPAPIASGGGGQFDGHGASGSW